MKSIYPFLLKVLDINEYSIQENDGNKYEFINTQALELKANAATVIYVIAKYMNKAFYPYIN